MESLGTPSSGHLFFYGDDRLEGVLEYPRDGCPLGGIVVAHPHPLFGGTMAHPVVYRAARACAARGLASLRFNFRGVAKSAGSYDGEREYRDVEAAGLFLRGRLKEDWARREIEIHAGEAPCPGVSAAPHVKEPPLVLAGYSFGSVMAALAASGAARPQAVALIAFVVSWDELPPAATSHLAAFKGPVLAVCGERDELAPPELVGHVLRGLGVQFHLDVVRGADHFFVGKQQEVGELVAAFAAHAAGVGV
jgi:uncharacterized protein